MQRWARPRSYDNLISYTNTTNDASIMSDAFQLSSYCDFVLVATWLLLRHRHILLFPCTSTPPSRDHAWNECLRSGVSALIPFYSIDIVDPLLEIRNHLLCRFISHRSGNVYAHFRHWLDPRIQKSIFYFTRPNENVSHLLLSLVTFFGRMLENGRRICTLWILLDDR